MYLCSWLDKKLNRVRIDNIGPDGKIQELKKIIIGIMNKDCDCLGGYGLFVFT